MSLTHLESLEAESIHIIREVVDTAENPDIHIESDELLPDAAAELILNKLIQKEII